MCDNDTHPRVGTRIKFINSLGMIDVDELATLVSSSQIEDEIIRKEAKKFVLFKPDRIHSTFNRWNNVIYCDWDYCLDNFWRSIICEKHFI